MEVLVSALIIGLALVMALSMIQTANRYGESAEYSASALQQAQSIVDKIRANPIGVSAYLFKGGGSGTSYDAWYSSVNMDEIPNNLNCAVDAPNGCAAVLQIVKDDMTQWKNGLSNSLPGGKGIIQETVAGTRQYEVIITWHNNPESGAVASLARTAKARGITVNFSL